MAYFLYDGSFEKQTDIIEISVTEKLLLKQLKNLPKEIHPKIKVVVLNKNCASIFKDCF